MNTDAWQTRTLAVYGREALERFARARVLIVGLGGVGSPAAELLCRLGVGSLVLVDGDCVAETNLNRQLQALRSTIGEPKAELLARRFRDINPVGEFVAVQKFLEPTDIEALLRETGPDCVVDAIDSLPSKCALIEECLRAEVPVVSSMGAGFRLDPAKVRLTTLDKTTSCPLARRLRRMLRERGVDPRRVPVVCSDEKPLSPGLDEAREVSSERRLIGSVGFITWTFGAHIAAAVASVLTISN